jgi:hypothetical protein
MIKVPPVSFNREESEIFALFFVTRLESRGYFGASSGKDWSVRAASLIVTPARTKK